MIHCDVCRWLWLDMSLRTAWKSLTLLMKLESLLLTLVLKAYSFWNLLLSTWLMFYFTVLYVFHENFFSFVLVIYFRSVCQSSSRRFQHTLQHSVKLSSLAMAETVLNWRYVHQCCHCFGEFVAKWLHNMLQCVVSIFCQCSLFRSQVTVKRTFLFQVSHSKSVEGLGWLPPGTVLR